MIEKSIEQIAKEDIESLIAAKVSERRTLDYKQEFPGNTDEQKREFLYDASSFANASGGDLVFGIAEERDAAKRSTGLPSAVTGVSVGNVAAEIARLENLTRDGIAPRIQGIQWKPVDGFSKGLVIVMRTPKSLIGPHIVVFGGMSRFYSRNNTGKYPMDAGEIRSAFLESTGISQRLDAFRAERLARVQRGDSPISYISGAARVLVHLVPADSLGFAVSRDVARNAARFQSLLTPIKGQSWGGRYNFDGYLVQSAKSESYVQVFRSGLIEAGAIPFLEVPDNYKNLIPSIDFERTVLAVTHDYLAVQNRLAIPLPIFAAITLLDVKNYRMSSYPSNPQGHPIDRNILQLPEVLVEDFNTDVSRLLHPVFDALWQSSGLEKSLNYDEAGNWKPHQPS